MRRWTTRPDWSGQTCVILASGPSLNDEQIELVRKASPRVIAINKEFQTYPEADILYCCDLKFWRWHKGCRDFNGIRLSQDARVQRDLDPDIEWVEASVNPFAGEPFKTGGFDPDPERVRTGFHSGYQAVHVALHLNPAKIILLGYDMKPGPNGETHHHGGHRDPESGKRYGVREEEYPRRMKVMPTILPEVERRGIPVINCTPGSALECFPKARLYETL